MLPLDPSVHPIKNHRFLRLLSYRVLMVLAYQVIAVVVGWQIYQLTHDPLALGLVGLAELIPYFALALFAGYAVDHYSRRLFGVLSSFVLTFSAGLLYSVANGNLSGDQTHWIYLAIVLIGLARAFIAPTYSSVFAAILPREQYAKAAGVGSTVFQIGLVTGPALGGVLVGFTNLAVAYAVSMVFALMAALALLSLKLNKKPAGESASMLKGIGEGLKFVFNNQVILGAQALDMFAVLFGGMVAMLPVFIHDVYHYGAEGLGILRAAPAAGAMLIGITLSRYPIYQNAGRWLLSAVAMFGVCMIAFGLTTNFWLAAFILVISGVVDGMSVVLRSTIMQLMTPDAMRGRVASISGLFIGSSNELGAFESGLAARLMGLVPSVIFGGAMTLTVVATTIKLAPKLVNLHLHK